MLEVRQENKGNVYKKPTVSVNGTFAFPKIYGEKYRETSSLNISWSTKYEAVNLQCYQRGKVATPMQLSTNLAEKWFQWDIKVQETNLTEPYVFRIVNARGTAQEKSGGGFWSSSFFIVRDAVPSSTPSATNTPSSTPSPPPVISANEIPLSESTPSASPEVEASSSLAPGAIAGIVVGALAGAALLGFFAFWFGRRKRSKSEPVAAPTDTAYQDATRKQGGYTNAQMAEMHARPMELHGDDSAPAYSWHPGGIHKADGTAYVPHVQPNELDGGHLPPQELPGNTR
ncbi:uncharacterized protein PG998_010340 [Apiospora kogelbergensis]|uniref:uncharacterized protein n=1 Tax=Apiospora kogelbergensis TaxID=1337665 RepID=UPI0031303C65